MIGVGFAFFKITFQLIQQANFVAQSYWILGYNMSL